LYLLDPKDFQPEAGGLGVALSITSHDLTKGLYEQRMAKPGSGGRAVYDRIKLAAPNGRCPLCGVRQVSTLDHHLPKILFAALAVAPLNLVPACSECNKSKLDVRPRSAIEQTLHPYFDDITTNRWLRCQVIESVPPIVSYYVDPPAEWPDVLKERVAHHFLLFRLNEVYSFQATAEMSSSRWLLQQTLNAAGASAIRAYAQSQAKSALKDNLNSWKGAMYEAQAASEWYCSGGFGALRSENLPAS
jgi:hypothetical protein